MPGTAEKAVLRIGRAAADIAEITTHIKEHGIPASLSDIADTVSYTHLDPEAGRKRLGLL